jgi:ABC-type nickel/cobalt efflux system permease component RcnA
MTRTLSRYSLAPAALVASVCLNAFAGPGAHGPNGEHLDAPATAAAPGHGRPRIEAKTEQFELVATLGGGEFSMLIDRYATNEPVLNAQVEVESGGLKAKAPFHDDIGDYAVADEALLKLLATPGEHALVITVIHGNESDLLDATLTVSAAQAQGAAEASHNHDHAGGEGHDHEHTSSSRKLWTGVGVIAAVLIAITAWRRRAGATRWNGGQA